MEQTTISTEELDKLLKGEPACEEDNCDHEVDYRVIYVPCGCESFRCSCHAEALYQWVQLATGRILECEDHNISFVISLDTFNFLPA